MHDKMAVQRRGEDRDGAEVQVPACIPSSTHPLFSGLNWKFYSVPITLSNASNSKLELDRIDPYFMVYLPRGDSNDQSESI